MKMKKIEFSVDAPAVIKEVFDHFNTGTAAVGLCEGMDQIRKGLARISLRAVELGDMPLLKELERMGCVNRSGAKRRP
jgi:hypothetical protein